MRGRILIVDDEKEVLESTAMLVETLGYEAIRSDDASHVLQVVREKTPGVILQDVKMPGLNLAGHVASLSSDPVASEIPLILYGSGREIGAIAARHGAWGYLAKPFMKGELPRLLGQALDGRAGQIADRDFHREVNDIFHEVWDSVTAVNNFVRVLELQRGMPDASHHVVRGLGEALIKLENRVTRLKTYTNGLISSIEPVAEGHLRGPEAGRPKRGGRARDERDELKRTEGRESAKAM